MPTPAFLAFSASLVIAIAALLALAKRWFGAGDCARAVGGYSSAVAFVFAPSMAVLCAGNLMRSASMGGGIVGPGPVWPLAGIVGFAILIVFGAALLRSGMKGLGGNDQSSAPRLVWCIAGVIAPALAMLGTISPIDSLFLLIALAAASMLSRRPAQDQNGAIKRSTGLLDIALWLVLLGSSAGAALFCFRMFDGSMPGTSAFTALLVALTVALLLPSAVIAEHERRGDSVRDPGVGSVCGWAYLKLLVATTVLLLVREVAREIASFAAQASAALEMGLPITLFPSQDLQIDGFALAAPELFLAVPLAGLAVLLPSVRTLDSGSKAGVLAIAIRGIGVLIMLGGLVGFAWRAVGPV